MAERDCRQLLSADDNDEMAIYVLAQILNRRGEYREASDLMHHLLGINPMQAHYHNDYGVMLAAQSRWPEAEAAHRMASVIDPSGIDANFNLALALFRQKRFEDAGRVLDRLAILAPELPDLYALRGELLRAEEQPGAAVEALSKAITLGMKTADVYVNLGLALEDLSRSDEAMAALSVAGALSPEDAAACFHLGNQYRARGQLDEAAEYFRRALTLRPDLAEAHNNLGLVLQAKDESVMAAVCFEKALALDPAMDAAHSNLGSSLLKQGWMENAISSFRQALAINPNSAEAWNNLGNVYFRLRRLDEAEGAYRESLRLKPSYVEADLNLGILLLLKGDFTEGWRRYENRWGLPGVAEKRPKFAQPEWAGEALAGKTLLVYSEQGMGDNIQFIRYLPVLRKRYPGARIYFWCLAPLYRLFQECAAAWGIEALPPTIAGGLPPIDYQVALLTLPLRLATVLASIPAEVPYIKAPSELREKWAERLAHLPGKKIGLVWASGEIYAYHRFRTIRLKQLESLFAAEGVSWVSLQKGSGASQIAEEGFDAKIFDPMDTVEDFADTAAIIANLDLVISVDTSVPHLVGALGVPVWLLDRFDTDWRWLLDRSDCPWYPTMRIFRQTTFGDWGPVMDATANALTDWLAGRSIASPVVLSATPAISPVPAPGAENAARLKLNLGCGNRKMPGFVNVDCVDVCQPDLVVNLEAAPWPWQDDSVDEIKLIHVLEHLGQQTDCFLAIVKEMWRVCCDGASIQIVVPHPRSDHYLGDPTHVRPVTAAMLDLFNQRLNREWAALGASNTPLGQILGVDFEIESALHTLDPVWQRRQAAGELSEAELRQAVRQYSNVVEQTTIVWRVRKPAR